MFSNLLPNPHTYKCRCLQAAICRAAEWEFSVRWRARGCWEAFHPLLPGLPATGTSWEVLRRAVCRHFMLKEGSVSDCWCVFQECHTYFFHLNHQFVMHASMQYYGGDELWDVKYFIVISNNFMLQGQNSFIFFFDDFFAEIMTNTGLYNPGGTNIAWYKDKQQVSDAPIIHLYHLIFDFGSEWPINIKVSTLYIVT